MQGGNRTANHRINPRLQDDDDPPSKLPNTQQEPATEENPSATIPPIISNATSGTTTITSERYDTIHGILDLRGQESNTEPLHLRGQESNILVARAIENTSSGFSLLASFRIHDLILEIGRLASALNVELHPGRILYDIDQRLSCNHFNLGFNAGITRQHFRIEDYYAVLFMGFMTRNTYIYSDAMNHITIREGDIREIASYDFNVLPREPLSIFLAPDAFVIYPMVNHQELVFQWEFNQGVVSWGLLPLIMIFEMRNHRRY